MRTSCFTFSRDGAFLGYPFIASIRSALSLCDEFIVAAGDSEDVTLARIQAINSDKIVAIQNQWNEKMQDRVFKDYQIDSQALSTYARSTQNLSSLGWKRGGKRLLPEQNYRLTKRDIKKRWTMKLERISGCDLSKKHFLLSQTK